MMIENVSKVLVVDNEQRELDHISKVLNELKIPAYYSLYSVANPPEQPFKGIRIAFFDINLQAGNPDIKQSSNTIANALKEHIAIDNGPYVLIYWTSHPDHIKHIIKFINDRESEHVAPPILIKEIDKTVFSSPEKLSAEINSILSIDVIELLFDYENKVTDAAGKTLKTIFDVVSNGNDKWGESSHFVQNFDLFFSNIAVQTLGFNNAQKHSIKAIRDGLNPILSNEISNIFLSEKWNNKLTELRNCESKNKFKKIDSTPAAKLNSIYHYDKNIVNLKKNDRGVVVKLNLQSDDEMVEYFGVAKSQIIYSFLPFDSQKIKKADSRKIKDEAELILLELSAACDYAQDNPRNYSFLLGIIVPEFDNSFLTNQSNSIYELPTFHDKNGVFKIYFNSRYVLTTSTEHSVLLGEVLFKLKNELMNKVSIDHSNYVSRMGIIQF